MKERRLLELEFTFSDLPLVRITLAATLLRTGLSRSVRDALTQAVLEAVANAVEHGGGKGLLTVRTSEDEVRCAVTDYGPGPAAVLLKREATVSGTSEEDTADEGHGLQIAETLTDRIELRPGLGGRGTTVVLVVSRNRSPGCVH
ncbi:ATP-binding protein [Streptomyces niger]|uniref:ATP-binding protein n=1 Tax=Streptomyces niger TaxID=66373 RepID=UPI000DA636AC|nr:ATP-binding protein [Streptomyces niger]